MGFLKHFFGNKRKTVNCIVSCGVRSSEEFKRIYIFRFSEFSVSKTNHMGLQQRACRPVKKFGFLKTHKCGSTTIQNMLLRYVVKHDLNLVVPVDGEGNYIS